jgi:hypothetical protein
MRATARRRKAPGACPPPQSVSHTSFTKQPALPPVPTGGAHTAMRATARRKKAPGASAATPSSRSSSLLLQLPFLPAPHKHTFNLLAALSEALKQCKSGEPRQVTGTTGIIIIIIIIIVIW